MKFDSSHLDPEQLLRIYRQLLLPRMIEEKMLILLRQGKISKWFSGIGQEAIAIGSTLALEPEEFILPMHRNLGVFTSRKVPLDRLFAQFQGKAEGFTRGRDRSFHFGSMDHALVGMISHLGPQLAIADGLALSDLLQERRRVTLVFSGDGGTSEGDFHEALNVASVWQLPVIFMIENNGYGLSTPVNEQYRCKKLSDRGKGYGMKSVTIDGNNVLEVYQTVSKHAKKIRNNPYPVLIEAMTFRMRGHEEASGTAYVPDKLMKQWRKKDPVENYEQWMLKEGHLNDAVIGEIRTEFKHAIEEGLQKAYAYPAVAADTHREEQEVYHPASHTGVKPGKKTRKLRFVDAICDGLWDAMETYDQLILMGQDIAEYGGVFKVTEGFLDRFGKERVRNTPLCESAILGAALGLSLGGMKSMVEMQFADFVSSGFNQIVNNLAKIHYRWGQPADVVVRLPTGGAVGAGPFHSQSTEAWFYHTPGLKIAYPAFPEDAKGLLCQAFADPNPVMFFEHKALYRSVSGAVPEGFYTIPFGKAQVVKSGRELTLISYGLGVHWALREAAAFTDAVEVIDLRTLAPIDWETIENSVRKTSKVLVLHEASHTGGIGGDIASWIAEHLFEYLDAPVYRLSALNTPVPFAPSLEENFLPNRRLSAKIKKILAY